MFETIDWHICIDANSKEKAKRVIKRLSQEIGEIEILSLKEHWKDATKYELYSETKLRFEEPEKAIYNVLQLVNSLCNEVSVIGPSKYEGNRIEFEGICLSPKIVGISWFRFNIANFR
ncbi:hypothetical protein [Bacillus sp. OAE603]|uniref:hypothetical protein n=1 Tax=Gottfriedia sp. OAE603 TaxID=2663872 RepID=UPI00178BA718